MLGKIVEWNFTPKQKSKATRLFETIISELPYPSQVMARMHPVARQIGNIPNEEIDRIAPRIMALLNEWYGYEADHKPTQEPSSS